jgi:ABC-type nitrate/sulfonate/bicarbonate transport system permease component
MNTPTALRSNVIAGLRVAGPPVVLVAVLVAIWEVWVRTADIDPAVLAAPSDVVEALKRSWRSLPGHIATTLSETGIGLTVGVALGILVACALAASDLVRRALEPVLIVLQTIPPLVLAPILVLALGFGQTPRIVVVVLIVFFPVAIATAGAVRATDPDRLDLVRSMGATRGQVLRYVTLPGSVPAMFDGVRISAAYAVAGAAIAEQIGGATSGIGLYIERSRRAYLADQVIAGVLVIAVLSLIVYGLVAVAARRAAPWASPTRSLESS